MDQKRFKFMDEVNQLERTGKLHLGKLGALIYDLIEDKVRPFENVLNMFSEKSEFMKKVALNRKAIVNLSETMTDIIERLDRTDKRLSELEKSSIKEEPSHEADFDLSQEYKVNTKKSKNVKLKRSAETTSKE